MARVVLTGFGLCSALGGSPQSVVANLLMQSQPFCVSPVRPDLIVCPVQENTTDSCAKEFYAWRHRRYLNRGAQFAVLAGLRAVVHAQYKTLPQDTEIITCAAPNLDFEREQGLPPESDMLLDALWLLRWLPNMASAALAKFLNIHGEGLAVGCACASSLAALGQAWLRIHTGLSSCIVVACGDSRLSSGGLAGYAKAKVLAKDCAPTDASRPFDSKRCGFVPGEGGAAFVLESYESALARKAPLIAEIIGYGASLDGESLTAPDATSAYAAQAVQQALRRANCQPHDIAWLCAHGTSTPLNDASEAALIHTVFAEHKPAITAVKSWLGHCSSACGALELAVTLSALQQGFLPMIRNLQTPLDPTLNFVREQHLYTNFSGQAGMIQNFGFGGQNAALVLRPCFIKAI